MPGFIEDSIIEKIREATDIAELIGGYVNLKQRRPGDYWGRCPFHSEKTASFHVRSDRGMFHCFGCGRGGNAFTFLMEMEGASFYEALKTLAERAGIDLPQNVSSESARKTRTEKDLIIQANQTGLRWFHTRLTADNRSVEASKAYKYLVDRGINDSIIKRYQIGWSETEWDGLVNWVKRKGIKSQNLVHAGLAIRKKDGSGYIDRFRARVIFPIHNLSGKPIGFGGRRIDGITPDSDQAKYINSPETAVYRKSDNLYGLYISRENIRRQGYAVLVEGYTDLLALVQAGITNSAASLGTALTQSHASLLGRFTNLVYIVYDSDNAGFLAAQRAADTLIRAGLETRLVRLPEGEDPDSVLRNEGEEGLKQLIDKPMTFVRFCLDSQGFSDVSEQGERIKAASGILQTISEVQNPLQKEMLLSELATETDIRREVLDQVMSRLKPRRADAATTERTTSQIDAPIDTIAERDMIGALLRHPQLIGEYHLLLPPDRFRSGLFRNIYSMLEKTYLNNDQIDVSNLLDQFENPAVRSFLTQAALEDTNRSLESDREEISGCIRKIKHRDLMAKKQNLEIELNKLKREKSPTRKLLVELVELNKELRNLQ